MRYSNPKLILAPFLAVLIAMLTSAITQPRYAGSQIMSKQVGPFKADRLNMIDVSLRFGQKFGVPMGIEYVDLETLARPITVELKTATLQQAMDAIVGQAKGYSWFMEEGVVVITNKGVLVGERNLLNWVIPEFQIRKATLAEANQTLQMTLDRQINPAAQGWIGSYSPGRSRTQIGPMQLRGLTVRQVLCHLVKAQGSSAWIVKVPADKAGSLPSSGLWAIVEYDNYDQPYAPTLRQWIISLEAVPQKEER